MQTPYNPNGSMYAIRVLFLVMVVFLVRWDIVNVKAKTVLKNVYGEMDQKLFEAGVNYFRGGK